MKNILVRSFLLLAVWCAACSYSNGQQASYAPLTNQAVVKLVRAGFKEKTVIAIINNRPSRFNLEPDRLIELKRSGVSDKIILAMLAQDDSFVMFDDWGDDGFSRSRSNNEPSGRSGDTGIFGSSQGSRSQTRGRGSDDSSQGETTTTGSATVRIIRPSSEADGGPLKLEKTPTLNNEAVIKLVEAGFSEGTIVKRIEDSPADFDLSPSRVDELRRRRVTEPIIVAMSVAMGDGPENRRSTPSKAKGQ